MGNVGSVLFRKKSVLELQDDAVKDKSLKKALGPVDLTTLGIGAIIGAGIFVLTGQAAASYAGPAIVISFIFAAVACSFAGLCYAEFAAMIPIAGSAYTYSYTTLGEFFAWFIGWDLILEYTFCSATVAVGWSGYFVSFLQTLGITIPPTLMAATGTKLVFLSNDIIQTLQIHIPQGWYPLSGYVADFERAAIPMTAVQTATAAFNLPAFIIVALLTLLLVRGIKESATFNMCIVFVKVAIILVVIAVGFAFVKPVNWFPIVPPNTGAFGHFGWSGVARAAGVIFFAYIGFDAVSTAAQEARNPQRDMPIGILASLVICTLLYILVSLVMTGVIHYSKLNVPAPIAIAVDSMGGMPWLTWAVKIAAIAGLSSVILVMMMGQPRIFYTMSRDGLLPPVFSKVHPKYQTPYVTTLLTGVVVALIAAFFPIGLLGELVSIGTLAAFVLVCASVLVLRYKQPNLPRPFRAPWSPFTPLAGVACCLYLMVGLPPDTWIRLFVWLVIGYTIYFSYSIKHSKLRGRENEVPVAQGKPAEAAK
jgi:APA family basic amino acid/polyamine antiporter